MLTSQPHRFAFALAVAGLACSASAWAGEDRMLDDFAVEFGLFSSNIDANLRANGATDSGSRLDLHRDLGVPDSKSLPYVELTWRPWRRHEFTFNYYHNDETQHRELARDIDFQGNHYIADALVTTKFATDTYGIGYRYWAWIGDDAAFGLYAGLQSYSVSLKLTGTVEVVGADGSVEGTRTVTSKASTDIPDPYIGLSYRYQINDWARFIADGGAFKAKLGDIDATLYNANLGVEMLPWEHVGVVVQYSYNKIDADLTKNRFEGNFNARFSGLQLLAKLRF